MSFNYEDIVRRFNEHIFKKIPHYLEDLPEEYFKSIEYTLKAGGKRIRPLIIFFSGKMFSLSDEILFDLGMLLEILHTASLIHDDLPAIDNDDFRRGVPTCHKVFGEALAILAGDGLIFLSFEILSKLSIDLQAKERLVREFSELGGLRGMVRGEVKDVLMTGRSFLFEEIIKMYEDKTGALFGFAFEAAAICSREYDKAQKLKQIGKNFGIAFQIFDDIKDIVGDFEKIGKTPGKDIKQNKPTIVKVLGLSEAEKLANDYYSKALQTLSEFHNSHDLVEFLNSIKSLLIER